MPGSSRGGRLEGCQLCGLQQMCRDTDTDASRTSGNGAPRGRGQGMERSWQGRTLLLPIPPPGCCLLAAHWPASLSCIEPEAGGAALQRRPRGRGQHQEISERLMSPLPSRKSSRPSKPGGRLGSEPSGQVLARRTRSSLNRVPWQVPGQTLTPRPRRRRLSALAAAGMRFPYGCFCCLT